MCRIRNTESVVFATFQRCIRIKEPIQKISSTLLSKNSYKLHIINDNPPSLLKQQETHAATYRVGEVVVVSIHYTHFTTLFSVLQNYVY